MQQRRPVGALDELEAFERVPAVDVKRRSPVGAGRDHGPRIWRRWRPMWLRAKRAPDGARRWPSCSWSTPTCTCTRTRRSSREYAEPPWDVALREIAKVAGALPRPARHVAARRVPGAVPGRVKPAPDRHLGARRCAEGLDELHVDQAVLFPDHLLSLAMVRDPAFATALARAYNRWLHERWLTRGAVAEGRARDRAPESGRRGAGDPRATPATASSRASTCRRPGSRRCTATSSTTRCTRPRRRRACRS